VKILSPSQLYSSKKQKLQKILDYVTPSGSQLRKFTYILIKGIQQHTTKQDFEEIETDRKKITTYSPKLQILLSLRYNFLPKETFC